MYLLGFVTQLVSFISSSRTTDFLHLFTLAILPSAVG